MTLKIVRRPNRRDSALPPKRITTAEYEAMIDAGQVSEDDALELIEGRLVSTVTKNPPHDETLDLLVEALRMLLPIGWLVKAQRPLAIAALDSQPEPDVMLVRGQLRQFSRHHPTPEDVYWVAEVANTSLVNDQTTKLRLYARAGIQAYWIVNLKARQIEVYTQPNAATGTYAVRTDYAEGDAVPVVLDGVEVGTVPVADVLA